MYDLYLIFRSVTRAQAARASLEQGRLPSRLIRSPRALSPEGCAYALILRSRDRSSALELLSKSGIRVEAQYQRSADGSFGRLTE